MSTQLHQLQCHCHWANVIANSITPTPMLTLLLMQIVIVRLERTISYDYSDSALRLPYCSHCSLLYLLSWCKSWIKVDCVFCVLILLELQIAGKYAYSLTCCLWFHCELARSMRAKSISIGRIVGERLQVTKDNELFNIWTTHKLFKLWSNALD